MIYSDIAKILRTCFDNSPGGKMKDFIKIEKSSDCCGCGACVNACPKSAISMKEDEAGFIYPSVNETLCVKCGKCVSVCTFTSKQSGAHGEPEVYAAVNSNEEILMESSSGGIFSVLAETVIDKGGCVFGAAWADDLSVRHICVDNKTDLNKLRGSKYVQSMTGDTFKQAKELLKKGKYVCYSGTPCQISGLKSYLGSDYDNLLTVDIICHGVPSIKMLRDDLAYVSGKDPAEIKAVKFRDKSSGWGVKGSFISSGKKTKYDAGSSPYYFYFLKGELYRESCYNCRFPSEGRQGDITLGDYWGIRHELVSQMGGIDPDKGVSCVLVNSEKGKKWLEMIKGGLAIAKSDRKSVEARNKQLTSSSVHLPEHDTLLENYINSGYTASFKAGYKKHTKDHIVRFIKNMIPSKAKRRINDMLGSIKGKKK